MSLHCAWMRTVRVLGRCEHLLLIWRALSSAVVFQVLTAAVGICFVDSTVTPISITVRTTTKLKLLTRFAKRTPWSLLTRSREYEEDTQFDFEYWEQSALKKRTWAQPSSWKTCFFPPLCLSHIQDFLLSAWKFTYIFSFHSCLWVFGGVYWMKGVCEDGGGSISMTEGVRWRKSYCPFI